MRQGAHDDHNPGRLRSSSAGLRSGRGLRAAQRATAATARARRSVAGDDVGARPSEGELLALSESALVVGVDSTHARRFEPQQVRRIEVWEGRRSYSRVGATAFGVAGALAGALEGWATGPRCSRGHDSGFWPFIDSFGRIGCIGTTMGAVGWTALTTVAGGMAGALLGGTLGSLVHGDKWRSLPLDRLRVEIAPQPGGRVALGASVAF